jgi:gspE family protein hofB
MAALYNRNNFEPFAEEYGLNRQFLSNALQREDVRFDIKGSGLFNEKTDPANAAFLNALFIKAAEKQVSDIHFASQPDGVHLILRNAHGVLEEMCVIRPDVALSIENMIRTQCNMNVSDRESLLDGGFIMIDPVSEKVISVRVSIAPTQFGTKTVCRILRQDDKFNLDNLYMADDVREVFYKTLQEEKGLFLISGPTGSGKSTTLFCALSYRNDGTVNICTAEDPIEYMIKGANQVQVHHRYRPFAKILRSFLRQDPNIIMVGELRDSETAAVTMQAANTGHLVFGTVHTNSAAAIISRLMYMGVDRFVTADALLAFTAQRLVAKLCPHCRKLKSIPSSRKLPTRFPSTTYYEANRKGCPHCKKGVKGKAPVMEFALNTKQVRNAIAQGNTQDIQDILFEQPQYRTLVEEALRMSEEGLVDFHDALAVETDFEELVQTNQNQTVQEKENV